MGFTMKIGKLIRESRSEFQIELCEGEEPDGLTSSTFSLTARTSERMFSYVGWSDFIDGFKPLQEISKLIGVENEDLPFVAPISKSTIGKVDDVIKQSPLMNELNQDRAKWFCFWVKEAVKKYGDNAAIGIF